MPQYMEGQTATNQQTGQRIVFRQGRWVPAPAPKLSPQDQKALATERENLQAARTAAKDGNRFLEINQNTGTGEIWGIPLLSEGRALVDPRYAEMNSLTNRMAPAQRQAGSGAMSDKDVALYKRSVPNTDFPGPTNTQIVKRLNREAKEREDRLLFMENYAATNGTLVGAEDAWVRQRRRQAQPQAARPASPPAQRQQTTGKAPPRVGEVRNGYRYKGGNPADRNSWVKVQ